MDETKRIQDRIMEELKLDPIDQEVVVLYKGEKEQESPEFWQVSVRSFSGLTSFGFVLFFRCFCFWLLQLEI